MEQNDNRQDEPLEETDPLIEKVEEVIKNKL